MAEWLWRHVQVNLFIQNRGGVIPRGFESHSHHHKHRELDASAF
jgi:hypothetical protein